MSEVAKILRVNMTDGTVKYEDVPEKYALMAGRWLTSSMVADEVDPVCHPLGPNNKLVFAPGIATGTPASTSARLSVGGKSPLTGGIKEYNAGAKFAVMQARLGIKALVVEGQPKDGKEYLLEVKKDSARLLPADDLAHKGAYETTDVLVARYGKVGVCCVGPAGEFKLAGAGICFNDQKDRASRYAGRGGLGAVMGSKGLKAIVVDDAGTTGVPIANKELFEQGRRKLVAGLQSHDLTKPKGGLNTYGTAVLINIMNEAGGLPTRNFSSGRFEGAAKVAGEVIFEQNKKHHGKEEYNHACSPGCIIQCSNTVRDAEGNEIVSCVEYETAWALGPNCGIDDLEAIAKMTWLCNDIGLDTIEMGAAIGVAMEGGALAFGDAQGAIKLLEDVGKGTPIGRIIGNGTGFTGKAFGVARVPTVKNQAMPAYEPRAVKGIGITYATSTMGADHTAGYTIAPEIAGVSGKLDQFDPNKADLSYAFQSTTAFIDTSGHCLFIAFAILDIPSAYEGWVEECAGVVGADWKAADVLRIGDEILRTERAFNEAAGIGKAADRMPEFMKYEALPPHNVLWNVTDEALDSVYGRLATK
jgi:aldehyde:ferredoxin oxidoreductase